MKTPDSRQRSSAGISLLAIVIFLAALGLSSFILNSWGDRLLVRASLGIAWGGYCLFAFGSDLPRLLRIKQRMDKRRQSRRF